MAGFGRRHYTSTVVTDLVQIRRLTETNQAENLEFRRFLKAHHYPEGPFHRIAAETEKQIDCTACANCCRQTYVVLSRADVEELARYLQMPVAEVIRQYTVRDPEDSARTILGHTGAGCIFLDGNLCMVYEARPRACRRFPYLVSSERSLGNRMASVFRRAWFCPIVYNTLEDYKKRIGYHRHMH